MGALYGMTNVFYADGGGNAKQERMYSEKLSK